MLTYLDRYLAGEHEQEKPSSSICAIAAKRVVFATVVKRPENVAGSFQVGRDSISSMNLRRGFIRFELTDGRSRDAAQKLV